MTEKTKERLTNIMIGYFTALILIATGIAFHYKDTFLFTSAINFIADKKTDLGVIDREPKSVEEEDTKNSLAAFLEEIDKQLTEYELYQAINSIRNPRYRYVLMALLSGMTSQAIAAEMHCKQQKVYNLTKRAKKELGKKLNGKKR